MKRLLILMMLLTTLTASAKVVSVARDTQRVSLGFRGSFALSDMNQIPEQYIGYLGNGEGTINMLKVPAFAAGFAIDKPFAESFHLNIELKYVMKGHRLTIKSENSIFDVNYTFDERIGYLEVPVQPQFRLNFSPKVHMNLNFGPYLAFALHGHMMMIDHQNGYDYINKIYTITDNDSKKKNFSNGDDEFLDSPYSRFDIGLAFGLDLVFNKIHLGTSYDLGLRDINQLYIDSSLPYSPEKNHTLYFNVGFDF